jgi:hypothetical protein
MHNPLLNLMVDGEFTALDAVQPKEKEGAKIKPTPQSKSTAPSDKTESDACPVEVECPTGPTLLPFCPPPPPQCHCRKCMRQRSRGHCGHGQGCGYGGGNGNPYLGWPSCPICFYGAPLVPCDGGCCHGLFGKRKCGHQGCGNQGYGHGGWSGWNTMCGDGYLDGGYGCCMPPPPQQKHCRWCQRKQGCGNNGYGYGHGWPYGGGWGMGCGDGCMPYVAPPPPQQCNCRWCQRKNRCSNGYGYGYGCGYPGWDGSDDCGRHRRGLFSRCCKQQHPYPYSGYSMMPCMDGDMFYGDGAFGGDF